MFLFSNSMILLSTLYENRWSFLNVFLGRNIMKDSPDGSGSDYVSAPPPPNCFTLRSTLAFIEMIEIGLHGKRGFFSLDNHSSLYHNNHLINFPRRSSDDFGGIRVPKSNLSPNFRRYTLKMDPESPTIPGLQKRLFSRSTALRLIKDSLKDFRIRCSAKHKKKIVFFFY